MNKDSFSRKFKKFIYNIQKNYILNNYIIIKIICEQKKGKQIENLQNRKT